MIAGPTRLFSAGLLSARLFTARLFTAGLLSTRLLAAILVARFLSTLVTVLTRFSVLALLIFSLFGFVLQFTLFAQEIGQLFKLFALLFRHFAFHGVALTAFAAGCELNLQPF